ncbi:MAG: hypothetical protein WBY88_09185 [Desulfosarcina sp.]
MLIFIEPHGLMIVLALIYFNLLNRFVFFPIQIVVRLPGIAA